MVSKSAANKIHPVFKAVRKWWEPDFNNRVRLILDGKLPSRFEVAGKFPAANLSIRLHQYNVTHDDDKDRMLPNSSNILVSPLTVRYICNQQHFDAEYQGFDRIIECGSLSPRLDAISNKLFRGYGALNKKVDKEMEGLDEASRTILPKAISPTALSFPAFLFRSGPKVKNILPWLQMARTRSTGSTAKQVVVFDESNFEELAQNKADRVERALRDRLSLDERTVKYYMNNMKRSDGKIDLVRGPWDLKINYPACSYRRIKISPTHIKHQQAMDPKAVLLGTVPDAEYLARCRDPSQYRLEVNKRVAIELDVPAEIELTSLSIGLVDHELASVLQTPSTEVRDAILMWMAGIEVEQLPSDCLAPFMPLNRVNASQFLEVASKSWFGQGEETVYDETIRKGKELVPSQFELQLATPDALNGVMEEVKKALFPTAKALYFRVSKLAIYEPGGHFAVHRDTVRHQTHQGSLLVEIPSEHTGGDLVLEMNDQRVVWSLNRKRRARQIAKSISGQEGVQALPDVVKRRRNAKFTAFYTDVKHTVQPVEAGVRMVIQYDIFVDSDGEVEWQDIVPDKNPADMLMKFEVDDEASDSDKDDYFQKTSYFGDTPLDDKRAQAITHELSTYVSDDKGLAIPLFHCYTSTQVKHTSLKASDRSLFLSILKAGYCVQITPFLIDAVSDWDGSFTEGEYTMKPLPSVLTKSEIGYIMNEKGDIVEVDIADETDPGVANNSAHRYPNEVIYASTGFEQTSTLCSTPYAERTGNESASAENQYFAVAFVVTTRTAVVLDGAKTE